MIEAARRSPKVSDLSVADTLADGVGILKTPRGHKDLHASPRRVDGQSRLPVSDAVLTYFEQLQAALWCAISLSLMERVERGIPYA